MDLVENKPHFNYKKNGKGGRCGWEVWMEGRWKVGGGEVEGGRCKVGDGRWMVGVSM